MGSASGSACLARTPLYLTVAEELLRQVAGGRWRPGERLPSEHQLAKALFVSRVTLREALAMLERDGFISRQHGVGWFVQRLPGRAATELDKLEPFALGIRRAGFAPTEEIVAVDPIRLETVDAEALQMPAGGPGYRLEMLRRLDGTPIVYSRDHVRPDVLDPDEFRSLGRNILDYLRETGRPPVRYAPMRLRAVHADEHQRSLLQCDALEPLIRLDGVAYDGNHKPLYVTCFLIRSKHYELTFVRR
jgi:DNA-binding GntR family transcriptional regulator